MKTPSEYQSAQPSQDIERMRWGIYNNKINTTFENKEKTHDNLLATLIQRYDKNHSMFIQFKNEGLTEILRLSISTFMLVLILLFEFIKILDKKMSIF